MTLDELDVKCTAAEAGPFADPQIVLLVRRRFRGDRARIFPGVIGRVVQWGDGRTTDSVVLVRCADVRRFIERTRQQTAGAREGDGT